MAVKSEAAVSGSADLKLVGNWACTTPRCNLAPTNKPLDSSLAAPSCRALALASKILHQVIVRAGTLELQFSPCGLESSNPQTIGHSSFLLFLSDSPPVVFIPTG